MPQELAFLSARYQGNELKWEENKAHERQKRSKREVVVVVGEEGIKSLMRAVVSAGKKKRVISTQCIK